MTLKVGDIVRLNSGGPDMTVTGFLKDKALCAWFAYDEDDADSDLKQGVFPIVTIYCIHAGPPERFFPGPTGPAGPQGARGNDGPTGPTGPASN